MVLFHCEGLQFLPSINHLTNPHGKVLSFFLQKIRGCIIKSVEEAFETIKRVERDLNELDRRKVGGGQASEIFNVFCIFLGCSWAGEHAHDPHFLQVYCGLDLGGHKGYLFQFFSPFFETLLDRFVRLSSVQDNQIDRTFQGQESLLVKKIERTEGDQL